MTEWVLASNNPHKVEEVSRMLSGLGVRVRPLEEFPHVTEPPETCDTFEGNALQKARFVFQHTGLPTLADDSGLEVDALGGAPGVHSKRFTPEATATANNEKLLQVLSGEENRKARFVCALALVTKRGEQCKRGTVEGTIGLEPRGSQGFGYDPLFLPDEAPGRTMAELGPEEKDALSHRGNALRLLPGMIANLDISPG
jgi:XTP/dITP diphosphohydrolase